MFNFLKRFKKKSVNINISQNPRMILEMFDNNAYIYFSWPENISEEQKIKIQQNFSYYLYLLQTSQLYQAVKDGLSQAGLYTSQKEMAQTIDLNTFSNIIKFFENYKNGAIVQQHTDKKIAILPSEVFSVPSGPN